MWLSLIVNYFVQEKKEKEEEAAQMAGWTSRTSPSPANNITHKIVDSSSLNQTAPEHIETQVLCNPLVVSVIINSIISTLNIFIIIIYSYCFP